MTDKNIVIYQGENGEICVDARLENDTVWLTQRAMAEVFKTDRSVLSKHIKNVIQEGELDEQVPTS